MNQNKIFIAGENIGTADDIEIREDGLAYRHKREETLWEMVGYESFEQAMATLTDPGNIRTIVDRIAKYHNDDEE